MTMCMAVVVVCSVVVVLGAVVVIVVVVGASVVMVVVAGASVLMVVVAGAPVEEESAVVVSPAGKRTPPMKSRMGVGLVVVLMPRISWI